MAIIRSFGDRKISCKLTENQIDNLVGMPHRDVVELAENVALEMENTFDCVASVTKTDKAVTVSVIRSEKADRDAVQLSLQEKVYDIANHTQADTDQSKLNEVES